MKREVVYTIDTDTAAGEARANRIRTRLYEKFDNVQVYPNGLYQVRIVATNN